MSTETDAKSAAALAGSKTSRYKELFRRYGKIALGVHIAVYASFFAGCYVAVESKVDVQSILQRYGLLPVKGADDADPANRTWLEKAVTGPGSAIALAFICNKALMPVRLPITIALTPAVARVLRAKVKPT